MAYNRDHPRANMSEPRYPSFRDLPAGHPLKDMLEAYRSCTQHSENIDERYNSLYYTYQQFELETRQDLSTDTMHRFILYCVLERREDNAESKKVRNAYLAEQMDADKLLKIIIRRAKLNKAEGIDGLIIAVEDALAIAERNVEILEESLNRMAEQDRTTKDSVRMGSHRPGSKRTRHHRLQSMMRVWDDTFDALAAGYSLPISLEGSLRKFSDHSTENQTYDRESYGSTRRQSHHGGSARYGPGSPANSGTSSDQSAAEARWERARADFWEREGQRSDTTTRMPFPSSEEHHCRPNAYGSQEGGNTRWDNARAEFWARQHDRTNARPGSEPRRDPRGHDRTRRRCD